MRKSYYVSQLNSLERRCSALRRQYENLLNEHNSLLFRERLLEGLCDSFALLQVSTEACLLLESGLDSEGSHEHLQSMLQDIAAAQASAQVLQAVDSAASLARAVNTRISPRSDPLAHFKHLMTQLPVACLSSLTALDLAALYRETMLRASMQLIQEQLLPDDVGVTRSASLRHIWERLFQYMTSALLQRPELGAQVSLFNLAELKLAPEDVVLSIAQYARIARVLRLSQDQLQDIAVGMALFTDLLQNILEEQHQLQRSSSTRPDSSDSTVCTSFNSLTGVLQSHQQATARLQVLMYKEYAIRTAGIGFVIGCLTWEQFTQAAALTWPYPVITPQLAKEIARYYHQQQQEQEQQE